MENVLECICPCFRQFPATLGSAGRKATPYQSQTGKKVETGFIHFRQFSATLGSAGRKIALRG